MMGLFTTVKFEKLFCPLCGVSLPDKEGHTKDGETLMNTYSRVDFEDKFYQLSFYRVALGNCPSCKEWSAVQICNKSQRHEEFRQQEWKMRETAMTEECTRAHPNHNFEQWAYGNCMFYNTWCSKCKELGVQGGDLPPDLEENYAKLVPQFRDKKKKRREASKELFELLAEEED